MTSSQSANNGKKSVKTSILTLKSCLSWTKRHFYSVLIFC